MFQNAPANPDFICAHVFTIEGSSCYANDPDQGRHWAQ
jgi:hypothetical protein